MVSSQTSSPVLSPPNLYLNIWNSCLKSYNAWCRWLLTSFPLIIIQKYNLLYSLSDTTCKVAFHSLSPLSGWMAFWFDALLPCSHQHPLLTSCQRRWNHLPVVCNFLRTVFLATRNKAYALELCRYKIFSCFFLCKIHLPNMNWGSNKGQSWESWRKEIK